MDLISLRLFVRVVEEGTITLAAQREHIAAAAVSRRIADLEAQLNTPLLRRTNKGVYPTQAGLELLYRARSVLNSVASIKSHIHGYSQGEQGHIHLLANISALSQELPQLIASFMLQYPAIRLKIEEKSSTDIVYAVEKAQADIGIYTELPHDAAIQSTFFRSDTLGLLMPKSHPLALTQPKTLFFEQSLDYDQVVLRAGTQINYQLTKVAMEANRTLAVRAEIDSYETMCLLINAGMGIGVLPYQSSLTFHLPNTCFIPLKDVWAQRKLVLAVRKESELSASATLLFDFLQKVQTNDKSSPPTHKP